MIKSFFNLEQGFIYYLIDKFIFVGKIQSILLLFCFTSLTFCQSKDTTYKYWLSLGVFAENYKGITYDADYNFSLGNNFYKIGYLSKGSFFGNRPNETGQYYFRSFNVSIGRRFQSQWFETSLFCGPSYVYGNSYSKESFNTVGLAAQVQLLFKPANEIGVGFGLQGNLNFRKNFGAIYVNITLGNGK